MQKNKIFMILSLIIFIFLTLEMMLTHIPFYDESHAWMLSRTMNYTNFIDTLRIEGHPALWFLIIMPFAKSNLFFPQSIYIINYIFCLLTLIVLWLKSPFKIYYKLIITFSSVFLLYYSTFARCYTVGILLTFLILVMYKKQLEKPILYSILIGLTAHTNLLCAINASYFGIVLICKLIKNCKTQKKTLILTSLILLGFISAWIYPYWSYIGHKVAYTQFPPGFYVIRYFFLYKPINIALLSAYVLLFFALFFISKDWVTKGFLIYTDCAILTFIKFFYPLWPHHYLFLFINLIFAFWILCIYNEQKQHSIILYVFFAMLFLFPLKNKFNYLFNDSQFMTYDFINRSAIAEKLYIDYGDFTVAAITPYIKDDTIYPERTEKKPKDIKDGYFLTREEYKYPILFQNADFKIYKIKN